MYYRLILSKKSQNKKIFELIYNLYEFNMIKVYFRINFIVVYIIIIKLNFMYKKNYLVIRTFLFIIVNHYKEIFLYSGNSL